MQELSLSQGERAAAELMVGKLQRQAQRWPRLRWLLLAQTLLLLGLAAYCLNSFWAEIAKDAGVSRPLEEGPPASFDMPVQLWLHAEMNRQTELLRLQRELDRLAMLEGMTGVFLAISGGLLGVVLWLHWNDAPKKAVEAKLLRHLIAVSSSEPRSAAGSI